MSYKYIIKLTLLSIFLLSICIYCEEDDEKESIVFPSEIIFKDLPYSVNPKEKNYSINENLFKNSYTMSKGIVNCIYNRIYPLEEIITLINQSPKDYLNRLNEYISFGKDNTDIFKIIKTSSRSYSILYGINNTDKSSIEKKLIKMNWEILGQTHKGEICFYLDEIEDEIIDFLHISFNTSIKPKVIEIKANFKDDYKYIKRFIAKIYKDDDENFYIQNLLKTDFQKNISENINKTYKDSLKDSYYYNLLYAIFSGEGGSKCNLYNIAFYEDFDNNSEKTLINTNISGKTYFSSQGESTGHTLNIEDFNDITGNLDEKTEKSDINDYLSTNYESFNDNLNEINKDQKVVNKLNDFSFMLSKELEFDVNLNCEN